MKKILAVLLFFTSVLSAQTYTHGFIRDSLKVGTGGNVVTIDTIKAGSIIISVDGVDFTMDGIPWGISGYDTSNFYLDATLGDNANTGTHPDSAWQDLWYAEATATDPGDTIFLKRGEVWERDSVLQITHSGDATGDIVWDGDTWGVGDPATILCSHIGATQGIGYSIVRIVDCDYVTFQNIIIDGGNYEGKHGIVVGGPSSYYGQPEQNTETNITIQDCEIQNIGDEDYAIGILTQVDSDTISDITISNNSIHHITAHGIAIYANRIEYGGDPDALSQNIFIDNNLIRNIHLRTTPGTGNGIHLTRQIDSVIVEYNDIVQTDAQICLAIDPGSEDTEELEINRVTVRYNWLQNAGDGLSPMYFVPFDDVSYAFDFDFYGNVIYSNGNSNPTVIFSEPAGCDFTGATLDFYNNTVISTNGPAFYESLSATVTFTNNILYNTSSTAGKYAYQDGSDEGTTTHTYNLYFGNSSGDWVDIDGTGYNQAEIKSTYEPTAQNTDPAFTDEFTNLVLQAESAAVDSGTVVTGYDEDIDGNTVPTGTAPDIGAYEKQMIWWPALLLIALVFINNRRRLR